MYTSKGFYARFTLVLNTGVNLPSSQRLNFFDSEFLSPRCSDGIFRKVTKNTKNISRNVGNKVFMAFTFVFRKEVLH